MIANEVTLGKPNCQFARDYASNEATQLGHLHQSRQSERRLQQYLLGYSIRK